MEDSGQRHTFDTGAQKEMTDDKPRVELIPGTALLRLGKWYEEGAKKYEDWNWIKGIPLSTCLGSLLRHAYKYQMGDRSEDHPAAIAFWANAIMHFEDAGPPELNDLPKKDFIAALTSTKKPATVGRNRVARCCGVVYRRGPSHPRLYYEQYCKPCGGVLNYEDC
jgi:hypothetical protein